MILWRRIALLVGILATKTVSQEPKLTISGPAERRPALGENLFMECIVTPSNIESITSVKWLDPRGHEIGAGPARIYTEENQDKGRSVFIQEIQEGDGGQYTCIAEFPGNPSLQSSVTLNIYKEITFTDCPLEQNPIAGSDTLIKCIVRGNPPPIVDWRRKNNIIQINTDERYKLEEDGLRIKNFGQDDDGTYQCRARVIETGSLKFRDIKVEVHIAPKFIEFPKEQKKVEGETISLSCKASGKPEPQYVWTKRLQGLNFEELSGERFSVDQKSGSLMIRDLQSSDKGFYQCKAWNVAGEVIEGADLLVILKPKIVKLMNITKEENNIGSLTCEATGDPMPLIQWRKESSSIPFIGGTQPTDSRIMVNTEANGISHLTINPLIRSDDGLYVCSATNDGGEVYQNGHITVEFKPILVGKTPTTTYYTWINNPINMTCIAEAVPNATVIWNRADNIKIKDNPNFVVYGGTSVSTLQVNPIESTYFGDYLCSARNNHGDSELTIQLREAVTPGYIDEIRFKLVTATTITFEFEGPKEDGGRPILGYQVQYYKDGVSQTAAQSRFLSIGNPYILDNLDAQQTYHFSFAAKNDVGLGKMKTTPPVKMPPIGPPLTPVILSSNTSDHPNKFSLHWMEPLSNGAAILQYSVRIWKVGPHENAKIYTIPAPAVNYWLENLEPSSTYKVELRATNSIGNSRPADIVFTTAKGIGAPYVGKKPKGPGSTAADTHSKPMTGSGHNGLTSGAVVGIVIAVILVLLLIVDISCYTMYQCGVLMFLCIKICGKQPPAAKAKEMAMEEGKSGKEKEPIKEDEVNEKDVDEKQEEQEEEKEASEVTPMIEGNEKEKEAYEKEVTVDNIDVEVKDKPADA